MNMCCVAKKTLIQTVFFSIPTTDMFGLEIKNIISILLAQLVTCLTVDACLTANPGLLVRSRSGPILPGQKYIIFIEFLTGKPSNVEAVLCNNIAWIIHQNETG